MAALAIHTEQLTRTFKGIRAVDRLNLKVEVGTVYGLLGPAGAGKTTVARLLLGLLEPTTGNARVLGFDTRTPAPQFAAAPAPSWMAAGSTRLNAEENLAFYADIWRLPSPDRTDRIRDLLLHFGLWERRQEPVADLSQGMQQKLAIARTLLHRPVLLLLDEPTLGLDAPAADALRTDLMALAADEGVTILVLSASAAEVSHLCHRVGVIYQGRLVAEGQPQAMLEMSTAAVGSDRNGFTDDMVALIARRREVKQVQRGNGGLWIDLIDHAPSAPVVNLLVESGAEVEEVHREAASLDTLYHSFTKENNVRSLSRDTWAIMHKEWHEWLAVRSNLATAFAGLLVCGVVIPLVAGPVWATDLVLLVWAWLPMLRWLARQPTRLPASANAAPWLRCWPPACQTAPLCWARYWQWQCTPGSRSSPACCLGWASHGGAPCSHAERWSARGSGDRRRPDRGFYCEPGCFDLPARRKRAPGTATGEHLPSGSFSGGRLCCCPVRQSPVQDWRLACQPWCRTLACCWQHQHPVAGRADAALPAQSPAGSVGWVLMLPTGIHTPGSSG